MEVVKQIEVNQAKPAETIVGDNDVIIFGSFAVDVSLIGLIILIAGVHRNIRVKP